MIIKGYKTEISPNCRQVTILAKSAGAARFAYNWALAIKINAFRNQDRIPNAIELHRELTKLKQTELSWMYEVSKCPPQEALRNCDTAFRNFFRKCKQKVKDKKGFPKFKSKKNGLGSFKLVGVIKVSNTHIQLPRLGTIKLKERGYLPLNGKVLSASISERAGRWFVSLQVEEEIKDTQKSECTIGVDLGIKILATCSDGQIFANPKALKNNLQKLKRRSRQLSKKEKGSKNRKKATQRLAKLYYKIANIRKDNLHKITTHLTKTKSKVVIEDLNVSGMLKNKKLSRAISDIGLFEFRRQLEYKGKWYNCEIIIADRFYPSSKLCSDCGWIKKDLTLADRTFVCDSCGLKIDRDLNASLNLESYTVSSTGINACGEDHVNRSLDPVNISSLKQE